jgi:hypothetical protein
MDHGVWCITELRTCTYIEVGSAVRITSHLKFGVAWRGDLLSYGVLRGDLGAYLFYFIICEYSGGERERDRRRERYILVMISNSNQMMDG